VSNLPVCEVGIGNWCAGARSCGWLGLFMEAWCGNLCRRVSKTV
jgi:hypothetical protein